MCRYALIMVLAAASSGCGGTVELEAPADPFTSDEPAAPVCPDAQIELRWLTAYQPPDQRPGPRLATIAQDGFYRLRFDPAANQELLERWSPAGTLEPLGAFEMASRAIYPQVDGLHLAEWSDGTLRHGAYGDESIVLSQSSHVRTVRGAEPGSLFAVVRVTDDTWADVVYDGDELRWSQPVHPDLVGRRRFLSRPGKLPLLSWIADGRLWMAEAGADPEPLPTPCGEDEKIVGTGHDVALLEDGSLAWTYRCHSALWVVASRAVGGSPVAISAPKDAFHVSLGAGPKGLLLVGAADGSGSVLRALDPRTGAEVAAARLASEPLQPDTPFVLYAETVRPSRVAVDGAFVIQAGFMIPDGWFERLAFGTLHCR